MSHEPAPVSTLRLSAASAQRLAALAASTQRAKSQLVRFALADYLNDPISPPPARADETYPVHIAVRVDRNLMLSLREHAERVHAPTSSVLRFAIDRWVERATDVDGSHPAAPLALATAEV